MAHLHAILTADSPAAVLVKRGPRNQTRTIGWDRRTDQFDLSPDGEHDMNRGASWESFTLVSSSGPRGSPPLGGSAGLERARPLLDTGGMTFERLLAPRA